jgi:hypothetical protein
MGTITRSFANNLTTGGVLKAGAFNDASLNNVTALNAAIATGNMILLSSQTASDSASISFTTGIDSTYKEYQFWFIDIHPANTDVHFQFQSSIDGGSSYGVTATSTHFVAYHNEADTVTELEYYASFDEAQSTNFLDLTANSGNDNDQSNAGTLTLFNPSNTTYVKHFISNLNNARKDGVFTFNHYTAGYFNDGANDINAVQFKFSSGNIDAGTILMYGIN